MTNKAGDENAAFARRIRQVRNERFGEAGVPDLAASLGIPAVTWANYEAGVVMPASILLRFLCLTGVSPEWLLTGQGETFTDRRGEPGRD